MSNTVFDLPMLPHDILINRIKDIDSENYLRDRALIACLALGGFRISEVVGIRAKEYIHELRKRNSRLKDKIIQTTNKKKVKKLVKDQKKIVKIGKKLRQKLKDDRYAYYIDPLKKGQCRRIEQEKNGVTYKFLQFEQIPILKRNEIVVPKKNPPLPYHKEKDLIDIFWRYAKTLDSEDYLFDITRRHALRIVKKCLGDEYFTHYLRHHRITRLFGSEYNFNTQQVKMFTGHKDEGSLTNYVHLGTGDIRDKMI